MHQEFSNYFAERDIHSINPETWGFAFPYLDIILKYDTMGVQHDTAGISYGIRRFNARCISGPVLWGLWGGGGWVLEIPKQCQFFHNLGQNDHRL